MVLYYRKNYSYLCYRSLNFSHLLRASRNSRRACAEDVALLSTRNLALTSSYLRQRRGPLYYFLLCYAQVAYAMIVAGCHNLILPSYAACHCAPILETARYVTGPPRCRIGLALSRTGATCDARTVRCTATTRGFCAVVHARCRW